MFVKICGITRAEDADAAIAAGADALGFVFWPDSPRFVDPYRVRAIVATLPPFVTPVGVFVNQPAAYVMAVVSLVRLGAVQLHGDESEPYAGSLRAPVIKAVTPANPGVGAWPRRHLLLVDAHDAERRGGTGQIADWDRAAALAAERSILLAGGLTAANVADAIARVRPFGIDVSSGVERSPGVKDHQRLRALFEVVHGTRHVPARS
jgi:phosphoribosylanthranilate isomerase